MSERTQGKGSARRPAAKPGLYADNYEDIKGFGVKKQLTMDEAVEPMVREILVEQERVAVEILSREQGCGCRDHGWCSQCRQVIRDYTCLCIMKCSCGSGLKDAAPDGEWPYRYVYETDPKGTETWKDGKRL